MYSKILSLLVFAGICSAGLAIDIRLTQSKKSADETTENRGVFKAKQLSAIANAKTGANFRLTDQDNGNFFDFYVVATNEKFSFLLAAAMTKKSFQATIRTVFSRQEGSVLDDAVNRRYANAPKPAEITMRHYLSNLLIVDDLD